MTSNQAMINALILAGSDGNSAVKVTDALVNAENCIRNGYKERVESALQAVTAKIMLNSKPLDTIENMDAIYQTIHNAEYWLYKTELISLAEAARLLRGTADNRDIQSVTRYITSGKLRVYYKPVELLVTRRKKSITGQPKGRVRLVKKQDVEKLIAERSLQ